MSLVVRCDEPECERSVDLDFAQRVGYFDRDPAPGWMTWVAMTLGEETRHYCPDHHRPWP